MLYGWEGNRRSDVALTVTVDWCLYGLNGLGKGDEHYYAVLRHLYFSVKILYKAMA